MKHSQQDCNSMYYTTSSLQNPTTFEYMYYIQFFIHKSKQGALGGSMYPQSANVINEC